jgi:hypothetical protein
VGDSFGTFISTANSIKQLILAGEAPRVLRTVIRNTWLIAGCFIMSWLFNTLVLGQVAEIGNLGFGILSIMLVLVLGKVRGFLGWISSFIVFAFYVVFGAAVSVFFFMPFALGWISDPSKANLGALIEGTVEYLPSLTAFLLGSANLFRTLTSESLNTYFGTDPIIPFGRVGTAKGIMKVPRTEEVNQGAEERTGRVATELYLAISYLNGEKYNAAVLHSASVLRRAILARFSFSESLTDDEVVDRLTGHEHSMSLEQVKHVLQLGERCAFARYRPSKEETEKAIAYANEALLALSPT